MIIRIITYHAAEGKDAEGWMRDVVSDLRGVKGMPHIYPVSERSVSIWGDNAI